MGCASSKQVLGDAIDDFKENPSTGLVNLHAALARVRHDPTQQESVKAKVSEIFELLPKAMESLSGRSPPLALAACGVIEHCAKICNDPSLGGTEVVIAGEAIKRCQSQLVALLKNSRIWSDWFRTSALGCLATRRGKKLAPIACAQSSWEYKRSEKSEFTISSKVVTAVALASTALLMLEDHAAECRQVLARSGGIAIAVEVLRAEKCGVSIKAKESLALLLNLFADTPENIAIVKAYSGTCLTPYVEATKNMCMLNISKDMYSQSATVLDIDVGQSQHVKKQDLMQAGVFCRQQSPKKQDPMQAGLFCRQQSPTNDDPMEAELFCRQQSPNSWQSAWI